jgi:hypothetical protein
MKKIYSILLLIFAVITANAQTSTLQPIRKHVLPHNSSRAIGDTLMYMPLVNTWVNSTDNPGFTLTTEDADFNTPFHASYPYDFAVFYSTDDTVDLGTFPGESNFYHPWENPAVDTAFFLGATSYFMTPGTASNWFMFGPLTIPAGGATLIWYDKTLRYKDGYEVRITTSTTPGSPHFSADFTDPAIYSEADDSMPSATYAQDTLWELKSAVIPASYNGQIVSFAFHHTATDMDMLYLDEITLVEGAWSCDADFTIVQDTVNTFNYYVYNNSSSGTGYSYLWDFGDSTASINQYPTHTYSWSGPFQLCLTVTDGTGCIDTFCDSLEAGRSSTGITVTVVPPLSTTIAEINSAKNTVNAFPNPFNSGTTISYSINKDAVFEISVFDLIGNKVAEIDNGSKRAGEYKINWNAEGLSAGMYLLQLRTDENITTKKIMITK